MSLPAARGRPLVIGVCPFCAGSGQRPALDCEVTGQFEKCERCNGTGDLDEMRLLEAYRLGRADALADVKVYLDDLRVIVGLALDAVAADRQTIDYVQLRARIGG